MGYSFDKEVNKWDTEPDTFDKFLLEEEETENAKVNNDLGLDDIQEDDLELEDEEFDL